MDLIETKWGTQNINKKCFSLLNACILTQIYTLMSRMSVIFFSYMLVLKDNKLPVDMDKSDITQNNAELILF